MRWLLEGGTTDHALFDFARNFFVACVDILHGLVLGLLSARLDHLNLLCVLGIVLVKRVDLSLLLTLDALHRCHDVSCRHVLIDRLTVLQRLFLLQSDLHRTLRRLLEEVDFRSDVLSCTVVEVVRALRINAKFALEVSQKLIHACSFPLF